MSPRAGLGVKPQRRTHASRAEGQPRCGRRYANSIAAQTLAIFFPSRQRVSSCVLARCRQRNGLATAVTATAVTVIGIRAAVDCSVATHTHRTAEYPGRRLSHDACVAACPAFSPSATPASVRGTACAASEPLNARCSTTVQAGVTDGSSCREAGRQWPSLRRPWRCRTCLVTTAVRASVYCLDSGPTHLQDGAASAPGPRDAGKQWPGQAAC